MLEKLILSWGQTEEPSYLNPPEREGNREESGALCLVSQPFPLSTPAQGHHEKLAGGALLTLWGGWRQLNVPITPGEAVASLIYCETNQAPMVQFYFMPFCVFKLYMGWDYSMWEGHSEENSEKFKGEVLRAIICGALSISVLEPVLVSTHVLPVHWGVEQTICYKVGGGEASESSGVHDRLPARSHKV